MSDFSNLGDQIKNTVQEAVDTMNFDQLNKNITDSVRTAIDDLRSSLNIPKNQQYNRQQDDYYKNQSKGTYTNKGQYANQTNGQQMDWKVGTNGTYNSQQEMWEQRKKAAIERAKQMRRGRSYNPTNNNTTSIVKASYKQYPGRYKGPLLVGLGYPTAIGFGIAASVVAIVGASIGSVLLSNTLAPIFAGVFALSLVPSIAGRRICKRNKRYKLYLTTLGNRKFITFAELAQATGFSEKFIKKDIRKMLQMGMFPDGHMDQNATCLIADEETYKQYLEANASFEQRRKNEASETSKQSSNDDVIDMEPMNEELKKTIDDGKRFIYQIKEANMALPGEEITRKLNRLEEVTSKIFDFVEGHPEQLSELRKFSEYYLPISLKLVTAYKELEAQPIQGDNITKSKEEIIKTLDTINYAFENLLDSLYQSTAMEVSSDISVLEALFAQDGLTGNNDFDLSNGKDSSDIELKL